MINRSYDLCLINDQFSSKNKNKYVDVSGAASFCSRSMNLLQLLKFTLNVNFLRKLIYSYYPAILLQATLSHLKT